MPEVQVHEPILTTHVADSLKVQRSTCDSLQTSDGTCERLERSLSTYRRILANQLCLDTKERPQTLIQVGLNKGSSGNAWKVTTTDK